MTDTQLTLAFSEAPHYTDPDAFGSDLLLSSAFLPEDEAAEPDTALLPALRTIWHVANDPFRDFLKLLGLSQTSCARHFCIPLRTVQSWALGERTPPDYVRLMMAEICLDLEG